MNYLLSEVKMDEEKVELTDEEIVKAYEHCFISQGKCNDCSYDGTPCSINYDILNVIHRLQDENGKLKTLVTHFEQLEKQLSAEIERLKDENRKNLFNSNTRICELDNEKSELQKQVDEQDKEIDRLEKVVHDQAEQYYDCEQRTAKEICDLILEHWEKKQFVECDWLRMAIGEKYGVEVE